MRLSARSRSSEMSRSRSHLMIRTEPPSLFQTTPSKSLPLERSSSSERIDCREFLPISSLFFLKRSSSSITVRGITTSCSANLKSEFGLCKRTLVSSTKCFRALFGEIASDSECVTSEIVLKVKSSQERVAGTRAESLID